MLFIFVLTYFIIRDILVTTYLFHYLREREKNMLRIRMAASPNRPYTHTDVRLRGGRHRSGIQDDDDGSRHGTGRRAPAAMDGWMDICDRAVWPRYFFGVGDGRQMQRCFHGP